MRPPFAYCMYWRDDQGCGRTCAAQRKCNGGLRESRDDGEIAPGQGKIVEVKGKEIALFNVGGAYFAIDNMCTHEEASLADGEISGFEVTCPLHGAKFDVRSGQVLGPPAYDDVTSYPCACPALTWKLTWVTPCLRCCRWMRMEAALCVTD